MRKILKRIGYIIVITGCLTLLIISLHPKLFNELKYKDSAMLGLGAFVMTVTCILGRKKIKNVAWIVISVVAFQWLIFFISFFVSK